MTLTLDSVGGVNQGSGPTNWSWTHTPVGDPDAVLVVINNNWLNSYTITAVSYGGVGLSLVSRLQQGGDVPTAYCYFKSGGLPTGAQTVAVTDSTNTAKQGTSWALLGSDGLGLEVQTVKTVGFASANPQVTVECEDDREAFIGGLLGSGSNTVSATPNAGQTSERTSDFGSTSSYQSRKTSIHTGGDTTFGYSVSSFQQVIIAAAVSEVKAAVEVRFPPSRSIVMAERDRWGMNAWERTRSRIFVPRRPKLALA